MHEHAAGPPEEFPRHLTTDLVGAAEGAERRRLVLVEWGLGLALAAFALAFPLETLVGRGVELVAGLGEGRWSGPHLLPTLLTFVLGRAGLGFERAAFLISALSLALCMPLAGALGRGLGVPPRLASLGALVLVLSPAAWNAGSIPGPAAPGLAVSLALCAALLSRPGGWRSIQMLMLLAPLVDLFLVWLLPAVVVASRGDRRRALGTIGLSLGGLVLAQVLAAALDPARPLAGLPAELGRAWLALDFRQVALAWTALTGVLALGAALAGLAALVAVRRGDEEQRPPAWLWAWCLVPLAPQLIAVLPFLWLLGPALLGGLDLLARAPEQRALRVLAVLAGMQLALLVGGRVALGSADPLASWRARAEAELRPGDVFLSADPDRLYLAGMRYGLEVLDGRGEPEVLAARVRRLAAEGRRVLVDGEPRGAPRGEGWEEGLELQRL